MTVARSLFGYIRWCAVHLGCPFVPAEADRPRARDHLAVGTCDQAVAADPELLWRLARAGEAILPDDSSF